MSYYPLWIGANEIEAMTENLNNIVVKYGKEVMVCKTGGYEIEERETYKLLRQEINALKSVPDNKGIGIFYWEPEVNSSILPDSYPLGERIELDGESMEPVFETKQEIEVKTPSSERELDIPDYVFQVILDERKKYEKNRSRRQHGRWVFQDLDYICCSSYGHPRSKDYHFPHYRKLLEEAGLPHIRFHDLRHTYTTLLMKNDINQKAIAAALGYSKSIITVDTYTDTRVIIEGCVEVMQGFIEEVHPYDEEDRQMLWEMFEEDIELPEKPDAEERVGDTDNSLKSSFCEVTVHCYNIISSLCLYCGVLSGRKKPFLVT